MKVGVFLGSHFTPGEDALAGVQDVVTQAQVAEQLGYDSVFIGHHYLAHSQFLQPISFAAYLAHATTRVQIGFGIYLAPLHNPLSLAEELATLDVLSSGRLIAGMGIGYRRKECDAFAVDWKDRIARIRQYVPLLRALWRGETVTAEGTWGRLENARVHLTPASEGGPPIWMGAFVKPAVERAAALDAPWFMSPHGSDAELKEMLTYYRAALESAGHTLDRAYPLNREGAVGDTAEGARAAVRPHLVNQYKGYRSWDQAQNLDLESFMREQCLIGTPDWIAERIDFYERELGITHIVLRLQYMGMSQQETLEAIQAFGEQVLPLINADRAAT